MPINNASSKVVTVDEQAFEQTDERAVADEEFEVVDETPELEATVEQETQAKVDANHPDGIVETENGRIEGVTLEQEERIQAREAELDRISAKAELGTQDGRAKRARNWAAARSAKRREAFQKRAASVDSLAGPERPDPREELTQAELASVNEQTRRLAEEFEGWSRAAISRRLAERLVDGASLMSAVVGVHEELRTAPGQVISIAAIDEVNRKEVSVSGRVTQLWDAESPAIQQVGLIEDDTGQTKLTIWKASDAPWIEEGEQVCVRGAARNWYEGRVSLAVTGWTTILFPDRGRWWDA